MQGLFPRSNLDAGCSLLWSWLLLASYYSVSCNFASGLGNAALVSAVHSLKNPLALSLLRGSADRSVEQSCSHRAYFPNALRQVKKHEECCGLMVVCIHTGYVSYIKYADTFLRQLKPQLKYREV